MTRRLIRDAAIAGALAVLVAVDAWRGARESTADAVDAARTTWRRRNDPPPRPQPAPRVIGPRRRPAPGDAPRVLRSIDQLPRLDTKDRQ